MQFHLNGFHPGDPAVDLQNRTGQSVEPVMALPVKVDVLIVGCGPAGLTLATQLSRFSGIKVCIVDQKHSPLRVGQADGIACRSMEMMNAFGFVDRVMKEAYWVNETAFWKPQQGVAGKIVRHGKVQDTEDGLSEFPHVILNQARVHDFFLETMRNSVMPLVPHYARSLRSLEVLTEESGSGQSHPLIATFQRSRTGVDPELISGTDERVSARYVVGCDGARSTVRESMGLKLKGDSANQAWGVMDILAVTSFPDIRLKTLIQSDAGSIIIIPREGGYMVRLYIELDKLPQDTRLSSHDITADDLIKRAQQIFQPYTLEVRDIIWWSVYQIGQRLCDKFDNVVDGETSKHLPSVFIAGDACHTHSPKAGQGMNVSMRDSFNLGWKLASVIQGRCSPEILHTYSAERQAVAQELIDFDQKWSKMISTSNARSETSADTLDDEDSNAAQKEMTVQPEEFQRYFVKHGRYTAGTAIKYGPSIISASSTFQQLAVGFEIGTRFHSAPVVRLGDAKPVQLGHTIKADGRWRVFLLADGSIPSDDNSAVATLCALLEHSPDSPLQRFSSSDADIDSVIDVRAVFQQAHQELDLLTLPSLLLPRKGRYGLCDYEKCFCVDHKSGQNLFQMRAVNTEQGCIVVVRPDQHIAHVLPLSGFEALAEFFNAFMVPTI